MSLFWVDESDRLCTPPLEDHILDSITRRYVLELAEVDERPCTTDDVLAAREAFFASTNREAQPIVRIEQHELEVGERTRAVQQALRARIEQELATT